MCREILEKLPYQDPKHTFALAGHIEMEYMKYQFTHEEQDRILYLSVMPIGVVFRIQYNKEERKQWIYLFDDYGNDRERVDAVVGKIAAYE